MEIKILGTGCAKCKSLEEITRKVVNDNNIDATIIKVDDIIDIMRYNVLSTPALVVDEKVVSTGRLPDKKELLMLLSIKQK
jgi:small redox-active disulfide protein 2